MFRLELGVGAEDVLACLPGGQFFEDQVNGDAGALETRFPHHDVLSHLNELGKIHDPNVADVQSSNGRAEVRGVFSKYL